MFCFILSFLSIYICISIYLLFIYFRSLNNIFYIFSKIEKIIIILWFYFYLAHLHRCRWDRNVFLLHPLLRGSMHFRGSCDNEIISIIVMHSYYNIYYQQWASISLRCCCERVFEVMFLVIRRHIWYPYWDISSLSS